MVVRKAACDKQTLATSFTVNFRPQLLAVAYQSSDCPSKTSIFFHLTSPENQNQNSFIKKNSSNGWGKLVVLAAAGNKLPSIKKQHFVADKLVLVVGYNYF